MIYNCCICRKEIEDLEVDSVLIKTFFDKDFAHKKCVDESVRKLEESFSNYS